LDKLGFEEDLPESKKHLNYQGLNLQSKRIMNRMNEHLKEHQQTPQTLFKNVIVQQSVKTKTKMEKVDIIKDVEFFSLLKQLNIVK
jgi:hypothetical protein